MLHFSRLPPYCVGLVGVDSTSVQAHLVEKLDAAHTTGGRKGNKIHNQLFTETSASRMGVRNSDVLWKSGTIFMNDASCDARPAIPRRWALGYPHFEEKERWREYVSNPRNVRLLRIL
jgi:hypothetical protein